MSTPSRSRTPSRSNTPALVKASQARLASPPSLGASPSPNLTTLEGEDTPRLLFHRPQAQSIDSIATFDITDGILIQDNETTEIDDASVLTQPSASAGDEESKRTLRAQLRKKLIVQSPISPIQTRQHTNTLIHELPSTISSSYSPRRYYILTDAGKPVFASHQNEEDNDTLTATIGIMQAIISVFIDDGDKLRCINTETSRITFLLRPPIYYACVSSWGEPESVIRTHLEYLHLQIISVITNAQLRRISERRTNFDLRRLLSGAESFLSAMIDRLEFDIAMCTSSLQCISMDAALRKKAADALLPNQKTKEVLYVILLVRNRVVTLIRPKKHSIHPSDVHILMNTVYSPSILNSPASTSWIPVCLPKFNPNGHVNAYISFLHKNETPASTPVDESGDRSRLSSTEGIIRQASDNVVIVAISGGVEFETIRNWCDGVARKLDSDGTLGLLFSESHDYGISELGIPGLRHFVYKSRTQVQITVPQWESPYDDLTEKRRLTTLYLTLHDAIHARSGQESGLKLQYIKTEKESVMGWITQAFEIYITMSPLLPKSAVVNAANAVVRWVKREESRLFLSHAPSF